MDSMLALFSPKTPNGAPLIFHDLWVEGWVLSRFRRAKLSRVIRMHNTSNCMIFKVEGVVGAQAQVIPDASLSVAP